MSPTLATVQKIPFITFIIHNRINLSFTFCNVGLVLLFSLVNKLTIYGINQQVSWSKKGQKWWKMSICVFWKPKMTSLNILFCQQPKHIQFTVTEEELNLQKCKSKKLKSENFPEKNLLFWLINYQNTWAVDSYSVNCCRRCVVIGLRNNLSINKHLATSTSDNLLVTLVIFLSKNF